MTISDEVLYVHAAAARDIWLSTIPQKATIPEHRFSTRFTRKMNKLLKEQRRSPKTNQVIRNVRRTAAAVMIALVILFSFSMTVSAFRERVIEVVVNVFNELTDYRFVSIETEARELPDIEFGYLPDDMQESYRESLNGHELIVYEGVEDRSFELTRDQLLAGGGYRKYLDTEDSEYETFLIHGEEAYANYKNDNGTIIWTSGDILYTLYGNLSLDELKEIALSIQ